MNGIMGKVTEFVTKRSPGILAGIGIAGFVVAGVMAIKATPKANLAIDKATTDKGSDLNFVERTKVYAKHYWKPVTMGALSAVAVIGSVKAGAKQRAALEAAYLVASEALTSQHSKILEKFGVKAAEEIETAMAEEKMKKNPPKKVHKSIDIPTTDATSTNTGQWFYDSWTGRTFYSTPTKVREAVCDARTELQKSDALTLNEFYERLDILKYETSDDFHCDVGRKFGWSTERTRDLDYKIVGNKLIDDTNYLIMSFEPKPTERLYS